MNCIFCKIASEEIQANVVKKGENYVAFRDLNPQAPTHVLIIPKEHHSGLPDVKDANLLGSLFQVAAEIAAELGLDNGFRLVVNTGPEGGQTVFHLHIHLLGGRSMQWPPG
jgi:histidine triad (HIT) family protein